MRQRFLPGLVMAMWLAVVGNAMVGNVARAEADPRDIQAREAFAVGRYQQALDIFVKLYAEKVHPNYLRNIGRCYQNLGEPDQAISSFREYLRQARNVRPDERRQVEAYIQEMEALKRQNAVAAAAAPPPPPATAASAGTSSAVGSTHTPVGSTEAQTAGTNSGIASPGKVALAAPVPAAPHAGNAVLLEVPASTPVEESDKPLYAKWWFWAVVGGAVLGGLGIAAAAGAFTTTKDAPCSGECK